MNLKAYLWLVALASILACASFVAILWFFLPENATWPVKILLYISLFMALCGLFSLGGFYFRRLRYGKGSEKFFLEISFRQGFLLGLLLVGYLLMENFSVFYWWTALIFLIIVVAIEAAFLYQE